MKANSSRGLAKPPHPNSAIGIGAVCAGLAACGARVDIDDAAGTGGAGDAPWGWPADAGCARAPTTLAESPGAGDLVVSGDTAFWLVEDGVWSMPVAGGEPKQLVGGQLPPRALAVDAEHVYFTSNAPGGAQVALARAPRAGGPVEALWSDTFLALGAIALDDDAVYVAARWGWSDDDDRAGLVRLPKSGGAPEWLLDEESGLGPLVVRGGAAYFYDAGRMPAYGAGALRRLDFTTGEVVTLAQGPAFTSAHALPLRTLVVQGDAVIWAEHAADHDLLRRVGTSGGALETLAFSATGSWIGAVEGDGERVIWSVQDVDDGTGPVLRAAPGAPPETLLEDEYGVQALAAPPDALVWTRPGVPGELRKACLAD